MIELMVVSLFFSVCYLIQILFINEAMPITSTASSSSSRRSWKYLYGVKQLSERMGRHHVNAISCYKEVLRIDPLAADGLVNRGNTFKEIGRVNEAIQDYLRAIAIRFMMAEALTNLASAYKDWYCDLCSWREQSSDVCLERFKEEKALEQIVEFLDELARFRGDKGSGNAAITRRIRTLELVISICIKLRDEHDPRLPSGLNALASLIHDLPSSEIFRENGGPTIIEGILSQERKDVSILCSSSVVAAPASGNEVLKESFMDLKIDALTVQILKEHNGGRIPIIYDAIRVILTSDDNLVASQVFGYARKFAKLGIAKLLVDSLHGGLSSPSLISASIALKAVAVDETLNTAPSKIPTSNHSPFNETEQEILERFVLHHGGRVMLVDEIELGKTLQLLRKQQCQQQQIPF